MSLVHFFLDDQVLADEEGSNIPLRLSADDLKHFKVLRLRIGEHIAVIDAAQDYFECEITDANWDDPRVRICSRESDPVTGPPVGLFQGIAKGDKSNTIVRGATEVGVDGIVFVPFSRCVAEVGAKQAPSRLDRLRTIARSAAMQSGRLAIPEVSVLSRAEEMDGMLAGATCVLVFWEEAPLDADFAEALALALGAMHCPAADARVAVVIGPEGGLEAAEVEHILSACPQSAAVSLGPNILRTETAGVVAPALVLSALRRMMRDEQDRR